VQFLITCSLFGLHEGWYTRHSHNLVRIRLISYITGSDLILQTFPLIRRLEQLSGQAFPSHNTTVRTSD